MDFYNPRVRWPFTAALIASLLAFTGADKRLLQQEIGTEICYCAPNAYEFTLDFSLTCPPVNITLGDAVKATTCMVSPFGIPEVKDLVPVAVTSIDVLELNQNLQIMVQETIEPKQAYLDGDKFSYISYAAIPGEIVNPEDLPRAIQLNIVGKNQFDEEIINVFLITFTSACGAYPVLQEGQFAGWTRFVSFSSYILVLVDVIVKNETNSRFVFMQSDLGPPNAELCPAVPAPPTSPPIQMSMSMSMNMGAVLSDLEDYLGKN